MGSLHQYQSPDIQCSTLIQILTKSHVDDVDIPFISYLTYTHPILNSIKQSLKDLKWGDFCPHIEPRQPEYPDRWIVCEWLGLSGRLGNFIKNSSNFIKINI